MTGADGVIVKPGVRVARLLRRLAERLHPHGTIRIHNRITITDAVIDVDQDGSPVILLGGEAS